MPKDWQRFERYAHLIRSISLPDLHEFRMVCTMITQTQPPGTILFPNLRTVQFCAHDLGDDLVHYVQFMVPSVTKLEFMLTGRDAVELGSSFRFLFSCIPNRMNNLRSLSISLTTIKAHPGIFVGILARTLEGLTNLEYLVLPPCVVVGKVITSLSQHKHLLEINPAYGSLSTEAYSMASCSTSYPILTDLSFPSLNVLTFCTIPSSAHTLLANPHFPANQISRIHIQILPRKYLHHAMTREPESVALVMQALADNCINIADVSITEIMKCPNINSTFVMSYRDIRELLRCTSITSLKIELKACLQWTAQDVNEFASSLPAAITLMLNEAPLYPVQPTVRIATVRIAPALSAFARHCLQLRQLGVFVDARTQPNSFESEDLKCPVFPAFRSLDVLSVGSSPITCSSQNIVDVTAFLLAVLPATCEMRWVRKSGSDRSNANASDADDDNESAWNTMSLEDDHHAWQRVDQLRKLYVKAPRYLPGAAAI
ncbi:hypothetical protein Hypma_006964 [Hypsizygus marmoreus]|uniref:F-box domain-containing protein n=1 Tax=Hypsizygus marmoreus TaxID=39966 RepID=A0A369K4G3_HYPMA|nr:hypothetical protein Hypma_006964 [Hypsizygus marmoreus]